MIIFLFLLAGSSLAAHSLPSSSVKKDKNTVLVLWGTRHGNRHPEQFLEENPRTWGFEGNNELTSWGKKQAYGLGKELRAFVGNMVGTNYNASEVKYYASSAPRAQMTLQVAVAGFHQPKDWGEWDKDRLHFWTPIAYTIDDKLVRMYALDDNECPNNKKVWDPVTWDKLPALAKKAKESKTLIKYLADQTKWDFKHLGVAADLADNLIEIDLYKAKYPDWITKPKGLKGYTGDRLKKEIMEFAEIHQNACADYDPCGQLMSGVWLAHILKSLEDAGKGKGPKVIGYASHTEITLSAMKQMGVIKDELTTSAGFVLEFRLKPSPSVRLLNHDPNPLDKHVIYKTKLTQKLASKSDRDGFIPLKDFVAFVTPKAIADWKKACGKNTC